MLCYVSFSDTAGAHTPLHVPPGQGMGALHGTPSLDLPDGINVEEARMLEAAMLGVPYSGRMPDFAREAAEREAREVAGLAAVDPNVAEQRLLVSEQDAAYEESLALDRWGAA